MRIGLLIGGLGQGGAERQLTQLALGLQRRGHTVQLCTYATAGPAEADLQQQGVTVRTYAVGSKIAKLRAVRQWVRDFRPDVLFGSMKRASSLAVLANLERRCRVVATDMSTASYARHKPELWLALALFALTDAVVTQTEMNRRNLARLAPWLARRLHVIRNGVDTERFRPADRLVEGQGSGGAICPATEAGQKPASQGGDCDAAVLASAVEKDALKLEPLPAAGSLQAGSLHHNPNRREAYTEVSTGPQVFRFVCVGTVYRVKNPVRVVEAVHRLRQRSPGAFRLDWYGRPGQYPGEPSADYVRAVQLVEQYGLQDRVRFHGPRADIEGAYREADALVHVSLQEGIPNAVVEGMACGLPVVVSRVSDLPLIVETARNGFVCDETNVEAITDAMQRMLETPPAGRLAMGRRSRELAVNWFGLERYISEFEALYRSLLARP